MQIFSGDFGIPFLTRYALYFIADADRSVEDCGGVDVIASGEFEDAIVGEASVDATCTVDAVEKTAKMLGVLEAFLLAYRALSFSRTLRFFWADMWALCSRFLSPSSSLIFSCVPFS